MYYSDTEIAGFQFEVSGGVDVNGASGGAAADAGFTVSTSPTTVIGFSLTGTTIPAGDGVLLTLEVSGNGSACLDNVIMSDAAGNALDLSLIHI